VLSWPPVAAAAAREGKVGGGAGGSLASADLPLLLCGLLLTRGRRLAGAPRRRPCGLPATDRGVANLIAVSSPSLVLSQPNPVRRRRGLVRGMAGWEPFLAGKREPVHFCSFFFSRALDHFGPAHLRLWLLVASRLSTGGFKS